MTKLLTNYGLNIQLFFRFFLHFFVDTIANIYLAEKSLAIVNWPIEGKKQYIFARQSPQTKTYI